MAKKSQPKKKAPKRYRHPSVLADEILQFAKVKKRALGIDMGNMCGYAYFEYLPSELPCEIIPNVGIWNLTPGAWDTGATRLLRLRQFLNVMLPDVIFYEDARFDSPVAEMQGKTVGQIIARAISGSRWLIAIHATIVQWAEENMVPTHAFSTGEIKKHATGKGNSNKEKMIEAFNEKWGYEFDPEEYDSTKADNVVDAAFALDLGMTEYMDGLY